MIFYESLTTYKKLQEKYTNFEDNSDSNSSNFTRDIVNNLNPLTSSNSLINTSNISGPSEDMTYHTNHPIENLNKVSSNLDSYNTSRVATPLERLSLSYSTEHKPNMSVTSRNTNNLRDSTKSKFLFQTNSNAKYKNYYAPKCICIISVYPFFIEFSKILKTMYKFSRSLKLKKPVEKIIENLVIEVPVPPRGYMSVEYTLFNEKYILTQTPMNQLPFLSIEFEKIFVNFKIDQILEIYKHVLLETRIIFYSSDLSNLTPIIQGFLSLIYPFKYPFQFVTILPDENFNFLESVSPYIIGINLKYNNNFFHDHDIDIENMTILIVDIDNRRLDLLSPNLSKISQMSQRKKYMVEEFPDLPKHYKNKLSSRITEYIGKIKSNSNSKEDRDNFSLTIRNLFFQFIVNILQNYNKYLNTEYYTNNEISSPSINNLFKVEEYIDSNDFNDRPFYRKLIKETQLFVEFILKRMIPKDSKDKLEILLFDENLMEKGNRSLFSRRVYTPFIHSNLYDIKHTYSVQKHRGFSEEEVNFFKNPVNRREALKFGQEIIFEKGEVLITYPIFPVMMTDIFFKNSARLYFMPPNLSDDLEPINIDIVSKSHLGGVSIHYSEMENYIYLCWIQLWAMTFWYHDEEEKRYRFQQLLKTLELVISHEMEIFNFLFETLAKHGEDYMILKLYERLIFFKLNPSYSICTTVMKLIDKKQLLNKQGVGSIIKYVERYDFNKEYNTGKFRKRTFKNKYDLNLLTDNVYFYTWDLCIECQTNINLEKLSRDFQNMRRDILWAACPNCNTGLLPKIAVRFGRELNTFEKLKFNTSSYEGFVLYSPFHLKYNYNNGLLNEFGIKLDIDSFKLRFNAIFWDSVWYFKIKGLVYDFMLPYEKEVGLEALEKQVKKSFSIKKVSKVEKPISEKRVVKISATKADQHNGQANVEELKVKFEYKESVNKNNIQDNNIISPIRHILRNIQSPIKKNDKFSSDTEINFNFNLTKDEERNKNFIINSFTQEKAANIYLYSLSDNHILDKLNSRVGISTSPTLTSQRTLEFEIKSSTNKIINNRGEYRRLSLSNDMASRIPSLMLPQLINLDPYGNLNTTQDFSHSIMITEQSFINPNMLIDSSILHDSSRILDTDQSLLAELESYRGQKKIYHNNPLNVIKEDVDEGGNFFDRKESPMKENKEYRDSYADNTPL